MKRAPRQSWATRKLPPLTVAELERHLDTVARVMSEAGDDAHLGIPIWNRLQRELEKQRDAEAALAAARERFRRSMDRTAALSS